MSPKAKSIITILLLILIPLVGVIVMWFWTTWSKTVKIIITLLLLIIPFLLPLFYLFIAQPHKFSGNSMTPIMVNGQYFLTKKRGIEVSQLKRGDIIVYRETMKDPSRDLAKRIIGLPGEKIGIRDGKVFINDSPLEEPYLSVSTVTRAGEFLKEGESVQIPQNSFAVLGDNRDFSADSRRSGFVTADQVIGKYWLTYFKP